MSRMSALSTVGAGLAATLLFLCACGGPPAPVALPSIPVDVPSSAPSFTAPNKPVPVPRDLASSVSACASYSSSKGGSVYEVTLTNLSQFVLDVSPADGTRVGLSIKLPSTS